MDGVYALFNEDVYIGAAAAQLEGSDLYFVAILENGDEVRGRASDTGSHYTASLEDASIQRRNRVSAIRGVAMPQGYGVVDCIGDDNVQSPVTFSAYQLPPA